MSTEEIGQYAVVITVEGPLEAALSIARQATLYFLGGEPIPTVKNVALHRNMMADDRPYEPWALVRPTTTEPCPYAVFHGPGHQSRTRCRIRGPHEVHEAIYGEFNQYATWRGESDSSSGVFDEAPEADE